MLSASFWDGRLKTSSAATSVAVGGWTLCLHCGHSTVRPRSPALTLIGLPQCLHRKVTVSMKPTLALVPDDNRGIVRRLRCPVQAFAPPSAAAGALAYA